MGAVLLPLQLVGNLQQAVAELETVHRQSRTSTSISTSTGTGDGGGGTADGGGVGGGYAGVGARLDVIGHSMALIHLPPYAAAAAASASQHASARRSSPPAGRPPPPPPPPPSMTSEDTGPSDRAGGGDDHRAPAGHGHLSDTLLPLQPSSPGPSPAAPAVADLPELHLPSAGSSSSAGVRNSSGTPSMLVTLLELSEVYVATAYFVGSVLWPGVPL